MQGFDLPLAAWRAHATAMQLFPETAEEHHRLSADMVLRLTDSLTEFPQSRDTFPSSEPVRRVTANQGHLGQLQTNVDEIEAVKASNFNQAQ